LRYTRYKTGKKIYRVTLETDYRIFVPVARDSNKFKKKYKMRTEADRLNGRIDRDYIFCIHFFISLFTLIYIITFLVFIQVVTLIFCKITNIL